MGSCFWDSAIPDALSEEKFLNFGSFINYPRDIITLFPNKIQ